MKKKLIYLILWVFLNGFFKNFLAHVCFKYNFVKKTYHSIPDEPKWVLWIFVNVLFFGRPRFLCNVFATSFDIPEISTLFGAFKIGAACFSSFNLEKITRKNLFGLFLNFFVKSITIVTNFNKINYKYARKQKKFVKLTWKKITRKKLFGISQFFSWNR